MLEVGQTFKKNKLLYTVLDIFAYNNKYYALFSIEGKKLNYIFYEVRENNGYDLKEVKEQELLNIFYNKYANIK